MTTTTDPCPLLTVDDPFRGDTAASVPLADEHTVNTVLDQAVAVAREWRSSSIAERIAVCERAVHAMEAASDSIALEITRMMGKPLHQARAELKGMAERARTLIALAESSLADVVLPPKDNFERRIVREPLGVVLDFPAWNYPLLTAVNAVVPAVLAGNAVVVKHSPRTPLCGEQFTRAFRQAGALGHLVQTIHADYPTSERMAADPRVGHVVFTGSVLGGHRIQEAAAKTFTHVTLELGGNDPAYVAEDADVEKAADGIVDGAIYNAGQSCCAVERIYVHQHVYERFVSHADRLVRSYVMGDPMDVATTLGPIAQPHHIAELEGFVADAVSQGARLIAGGKRASVGGRGRFFEATLLAGCTQSMRLFREESFGPIVAVSPVRSDEDALAKMNDSGFGLTASVWTRDKERATRLARSLEYGTVFMNRCDYLDPALAWTGVKSSGRGVSLSPLGIQAMTRPKSIHFRLSL